MPASRFHDGQHGATHIVRVFGFGRELRIVGEDDATLAVWKTADVTAAPEMDPDGMVMLTVRGGPGVLLVDDSAELAQIRQAGIRLPGHQVWTSGRWIAVCAGLIASLGLGVLALNTLPRWIAGAIPVAWERRLGEPTEKLMTAAMTRCTGEAGQAALDRLVARLRVAGGIEMPVTISVLDDRMINAFTLPGGRVLVMRGLIADADDGVVLAGVIGHELGHVAHRDSTTLLLRGMGLSILMHMIGLGDASTTAATSASNLMTLAYTRAAEAAADDTAIALLTGAGLRADGLSRFFARMEHRARGRGTDGRRTDGKGADGKGADGKRGDGQGADRDSADGKTADRASADRETADGQGADGQGGNGQGADRGGADGPGADRKADGQGADGPRADGPRAGSQRPAGKRETGDAESGQEADRDVGGLNWFNTHPPTTTRRERTARPDTGEKPFTEEEWQAIRTVCARK